MQGIENTIIINDRRIGSKFKTYIIAEVSANHNQEFGQAVKLLELAKSIGADAIKLQTYTADTMTINCDSPLFRIGRGTVWEGQTLYELYSKAYTPWEWQPKLKEIADNLGLDLISTPFDKSAVDFLERIGIPAFKVASFEIVDLPLIEYIASKGKPIIISTGMAKLAEIDDAVRMARQAGATQLALLKCTSAYPAPLEEMNLRTIPNLIETFGVPVGLSDHTLGITAPVVAVALGASILEKHLTLSRDVHGPDSAFSLEPREFKAMVEAVRQTEEVLGQVRYDVGEREAKSLVFRRSLFVVKDMQAGDTFTPVNVRSIRPGYGLHPRYLKEVIGTKANHDIKRGTPLSWDMVGKR